MSKKSRQERSSGKSQAQAAKRRMYTHMITLLLTLAVIIAAAFFLFHGRQTVAQSSAPQATRDSVAAPGARAGFDRLKGRWRRPDGGYVLEIKEIDDKGKMVAAYFNPRPINVSRAEASQEGATTKVFIELRDTNYPGATYTLTYDPVRDQLRGVYFQPALQQSFDVVFVRMK
jgi:uncharacterized protein (DUF2147 family)